MIKYQYSSVRPTRQIMDVDEIQRVWLKSNESYLYLTCFKTFTYM